MVRVWACLNSQHSNWKISEYYSEKYPNLNQYISVFYEWIFKLGGLDFFARNSPKIPKKGNFFDHPDDMNLTQFDDIDLG